MSKQLIGIFQEFGAYRDWKAEEAPVQELVRKLRQFINDHFYTCTPEDVYKRQIPGKAYLYHAVGKPMILGENLANHELFSEQEKGIYFVEMGSGEKMAEKIKKIANIGR